MTDRCLQVSPNVQALLKDIKDSTKDTHLTKYEILKCIQAAG